MDTKAITDYILYLKDNEKLSVTLHPTRAGDALLFGELMAFNIHDNPYCIAVKASPAANRHCIACQQKVIERCRQGAFCGVCYAGVQEYVYPISDGEETVGFISVSGYAAPHGEEYVRRVTADYSLPPKLLLAAYGMLSDTLPPKERVDTLIMPLMQMLELAYRKQDAACHGQDSLYEQVLGFLRRHHCERVTSQDVCRAFFCSRSQIAHLFKKNAGCSIPEYLNSLRVADAKYLLAHSDLDIAAIAAAVGFADRNYFSGLFRKATGLSPREYRRLHKNV